MLQNCCNTYPYSLIIIIVSKGWTIAPSPRYLRQNPDPHSKSKFVSIKFDALATQQSIILIRYHYFRLSVKYIIHLASDTGPELSLTVPAAYLGIAVPVPYPSHHAIVSTPGGSPHEKIYKIAHF